MIFFLVLKTMGENIVDFGNIFNNLKLPRKFPSPEGEAK